MMARQEGYLSVETISRKENMMGQWCRRVVSLFVALMLTVSGVTVLSSCRKKSEPQKAGQKVGKNIENAGKRVEKGANEAAKK